MSLQEGTETHPSSKIKATSMIIGITALHATITISIPIVLADADDDDAPQGLVGFASCHGRSSGLDELFTSVWFALPLNHWIILVQSASVWTAKHPYDIILKKTIIHFKLYKFT
ncbi:hypothetical protein SLE2022_326580 [Rubroshorea leprosula]